MTARAVTLREDGGAARQQNFAACRPLPRISPWRDPGYHSPMRIEDIQEVILKLSPGELAKLRLWFAEFETGMRAPKIPERTAVKLGRIAGRTLAEWRRLSREP